MQHLPQSPIKTSLMLPAAAVKAASNPRSSVERRKSMRVTNVRISFVIVSLLVLSGAFPGLGSHGGFGTLAALAATPQQKAEARTYLNQVTASLRSVDTAYASGNAAEAQSKYEEARSNWDKVAPAIS